jgi:hypothetical protein
MQKKACGYNFSDGKTNLGSFKVWVLLEQYKFVTGLIMTI